MNEVLKCNRMLLVFVYPVLSNIFKLSFTDTNYETSPKKAVEKKDRKKSVETPTCEECSDETAMHAVFGSLAAAIFVVMVVNGFLYFRSRGAFYVSVT